jgi:hypothetical protein
VILELLEYLTTDCPADVRRLGYLKEAIAIKARYRRQCEAWGPHLARSRALVGDAAEQLARRRTALVLGSGLLLDIPLGALSASFERVLLADLVHLRRARRIAARYPNVSLVTADVTGLSAGFRDRVRGGWRGTPVPRSCLFHDDETIDLVVSANLMAQLPVMPAAALRRAGRDDQTVQAFCRAVVEAHLAYLAGFEARVCLVTEVLREAVGRDGGILRIDEALFGVRLPAEDASWSWDLAPPGEVSPDYGIRNRVVGFADLYGPKVPV